MIYLCFIVEISVKYCGVPFLNIDCTFGKLLKFPERLQSEIPHFRRKLSNNF
jgi:hypothetical protein